MGHFATPGQLCAWAGVAPTSYESALRVVTIDCGVQKFTLMGQARPPDNGTYRAPGNAW
jgi:hypothetical protein